MAGSTHSGEEEAIVAAYQSLCGTFPDLRLVLAPRHIERAAQVEQMVAAKGMSVARRSMGSGAGAGPQVLVLDTRGELALLYREAVVAFVGGTLVPVGGHNLLEPAVWGKPVLFGHHTDHCAEVAALLLNAQGGRIVPDADALAQGLRDLLSDAATLNRMGQAARQVVADNQGALQRSAEIIATLLSAQPISTERDGALHLGRASRHS